MSFCDVIVATQCSIVVVLLLLFFWGGGGGLPHSFTGGGKAQRFLQMVHRDL